MTSHETKYLSAKTVCGRYGVSSMTLWRWLRNKELAFPAPMYIQRRRYWLETALNAWDTRPAFPTRTLELRPGEPNSDELRDLANKWVTNLHASKTSREADRKTSTSCSTRSIDIGWTVPPTEGQGHA